MTVRRIFLGAIFAAFFFQTAWAALTFPVLTGRVIDEAGIISKTTNQTLDQILHDFETRSGNQVVVVTLRSLQGTSIEDYGYQLGRHWGIGHKGKDNGVMLVVAPQEHKVRIEVGYGLEGILTDARSSSIIHNSILPAFRAGHIESGVVQGVKEIVSVFSAGDSLPSTNSEFEGQKISSLETDASLPFKEAIIATIVLVLIFGVYLVSVFFPRPVLSNRGEGTGDDPNIPGGFDGDEGSGGSFGGGGASGRWY